MPRKAIFALAALLSALLALPAAASADSCGYQGSGNWSAPAGWSCAHVPTGADDVTLGSGDNVVLDQNASAATLTIEAGGTLQLGSARTLTVSGATTLRQATIQGSGTLAAAGALTKTTASQLRIEGGTVAVGAASTWNGGDICIITGGVMRLDATLTIASGGGNFVCNSGNGQVQVTAGGRLLKDSTGTSTVSTLLDNDGTVQAAQGTLSVAAAPAVGTDAGAFLADTGAELTLAGIRTVNGRVGGTGLIRTTASVTLPSGATLDPAALTLDSGTLTLDGATPATALPLVTLSGGTFSGARNRTIGALTATSGTLSGGHTATITGTFTKATGGQMRLEDAISFRPQAASAWTGGDICIITGAVFRIEATLSINSGAGNFVCNSGNGQVQVVSGGRLHKTSGGTSTVSTLLENDGTVQASSGVLSVAAAPAVSSDGGTFLADAGAEVALAGIRTVIGRIGGGGHVRTTSSVTLPAGATLDPAALTLDSGTLTLDGATPATALPLVTLSGGTFTGARDRSIGTLNATSGTLSGGHTATITDAFTKTTGGQMRLEDSISLRPQIDATWTGGDICIITSAALRIEATFAIGTGAGNFVCNSGNGQVQVVAGGRLHKTSGGTSTVSTLLDNDGTVQASSGVLSLAAGPGTDSGTFLADSELTFAGIRTLAATARIGGAGLARTTAGVTLPAGATLDPAALTLDSGTLTLDGSAPATTLPLVTLSGGTFAGSRDRIIGTLNATSGTLSGGHVATITGTFAKTTAGQLRFEDSISVRPQLDTTWTGGDICIITGAALRISATWTIGTGAGGFVCNSGNGEIQILASGRLQKSPAGATTIATRTLNAGLVTVGTGQSLDFSNLTVQPGGTLTGSGTAGGAITNAGGTVSPAAGAFTLGSFTQSSGLTDVAAGETLTATSYAISGGTLAANGTVGGPVTVTASGVLAGSGQVNGNVSNTTGSMRPRPADRQRQLHAERRRDAADRDRQRGRVRSARGHRRRHLRRHAGDRQRVHAREHRHVPDRHVRLAQRHVRDGDRPRAVRRRLSGRTGLRRTPDRLRTACARRRRAAGHRHGAGRPDRHLQPGHLGQQPDVHVRVGAQRPADRDRLHVRADRSRRDARDLLSRDRHQRRRQRDGHQRPAQRSRGLRAEHRAAGDLRHPDADVQPGHLDRFPGADADDRVVARRHGDCHRPDVRPHRRPTPATRSRAA